MDGWIDGRLPEWLAAEWLLRQLVSRILLICEETLSRSSHRDIGLSGYRGIQANAICGDISKRERPL